MHTMLVEVTHQQTAGKKITHENIPAFFYREIALGIQQDGLQVLRTQQQHRFLPCDRDAAHCAKLLIVLMKSADGVCKHGDGFSHEGQTLFTLDVVELLVGGGLAVIVLWGG